ncbi:MAG TPA: acyl-CoA synthetase [Thermoplasmata archaeon]|nr:acyl-CoA synthetase [Thermoplasmata archaeon]
MNRPIVSVVGDRNLPESDPLSGLAEELGRALVGAGYAVATGGLGSLAAHIASGARSSEEYREGRLIAVLPGFDPAAAECKADIVLATGLDHARNFIVANSDAVVALGGGAGTLSEIGFAWALHRLVIAYRVNGWSGKVADTKIDERIRYPDIPEDRVYGVDTAFEVLALLSKFLPLYQRRHQRIPDR